MTYPTLVFQGEIPTSDSLNKALNDLQTQINTLSAGGGTGTVTSVSVVTANGMSGTVATATTTPAITLVVGAINLATATGLPEAGLSLTDITTNNVSITKHGFAPKGPNDATKYLDGTGAYSVPAGSGGSITIGTTTITGGTTTRLLYDAAGVVGEISGATSNGTALTLVAPVLGTPASGTLTNCTGLPAAGVVGTAAVLGANTFTGAQTFSATLGAIFPGSSSGSVTVLAPAAAGSSTLTLANTSMTLQPINNMTDTWNSSGTTFIAIKMVVSDTGHAAASRLLSLQLGGSEQFGVDGDGAFYTQASVGNQIIWYLRGSPLIQGNGTNLNLFTNEAIFGGINNGQHLSVKELTELTTVAAAATTDTAIQMPAGAIVLAVSVRVTTVIPTATSFSVGDAGNATRFGTSATISVAATTTDAGTAAGAYYNASATSVRLTMNGGTPAANTGRVRVSIFYFLSTPPTS